jgi:anti-anti-sigma factor
MSENITQHVEVAAEQGVLILTLLDRELRDERQCAAIRQEFLAAVQESNAKKIVVDFRNVTFVASVGFRPLLSLRRLVHDTGGRLVLCCLGEYVKDVFQATQLLVSHKVAGAPFEEQPDLVSAIAYLNRDAAP